jgi:hypothetical protein
MQGGCSHSVRASQTRPQWEEFAVSCIRLAVATLVAFAMLVPSAVAATTVEGRLEILHMDMADRQTREVPQLVVGSRRYELVGAQARRVAPGSTVRVTGSVRGERIEADAVQLVAPAAAAPAGVTTSVLAILVQSSGPDDVTPELVEDQLEGKDSQWFRDVSKGQIAGLAVDATEWLTVAQSPCSLLFAPLEAAAAAAGYDLAAYDRLMFYFPYDATCPFGGAALIGGNQTAINGRDSLENGTTLHELGHNYGLDHANQLRCTDAGVFVAFPRGNCFQVEYGDQHDVMGYSMYYYDDAKGHYGAYHLDQLGWLDGRVVDAPSTGGKFDIAPIEQVRLGLQVVRLNDGDRTYWLYFRQPIGVDAFLTQEPGATDGVSVQIKGSGLYGGSAQLDMTPDENFGDVTLKSGVTWTTPNGAFRIQVTSVSGKSAGIRIKAAGECRALGWQTLMTTDGDAFVSEGACKAYVTRGGILLPLGCFIRNTRSGATFTGGLQSAQNAAQAGDTLTVKGTCSGAVLDKDLTITGIATAGRGAPTLRGGNQQQALASPLGATVTVNALTITGGDAYYGGGIWNSAVMTLNDVVVRGNSGGVGGGIINLRQLGSIGKLTLNRSTVTGNSAQSTDSDAASGRGGGIFNAGDVTLNDSVVSGNTAGRTGGGVFNVDPPFDDPPFEPKPNTLTLTGTSTVTGNTPDDVVWGPF